MTMQHDFFAAVDDIIRDDEDFSDEMFAALTAAASEMDEIEQIMFATAQFFLREAISIDEPRLFHAGFACLALTGLFEAVIGQVIDGPKGLMDIADHCWGDAKAVADQAIARLVWGVPES